MENNTTPFKRVKPSQTSILVDLDLPFEPDIHNVFYVENEYNPAINEFIQEHYEDLQQRFLAKDVSFCYLPKLSGHEVPEEVLRYMFPYLSEGSTCVNADFDMEVLKSHIISLCWSKERRGMHPNENNSNSKLRKVINNYSRTLFFCANFASLIITDKTR